MRTSVLTNSQDTGDTDEFPGCFGTVGEDGSLDLVDFEDNGVMASYRAGAWVGYETYPD
jgi:hypothetical protein